MKILGKAIGIDFGTTNTVVSYRDKNNNLRALRYDGSFLIPSVLYFKSKEDYYIGTRAKGMMKLKPDAGVDNFKSLLGVRGKYRVTADNGDQFPLVASKAVEYFLNKVIKGVEDRLIREFGPTEGVIDRAVITVPAKFNDTEIFSIKYAAMRAMGIQGMQNLRLVYEPTAAAVAAQQFEPAAVSTVLIYDFGGGTFDVSVLKKENGKHHQIETDGNKKLGGNDLTNIVAEELLRRINDEYGTEFPIDENEFDEDYHNISLDEYTRNMTNIRTLANTVKEDLSQSEEEEIDLTIFVTNNKSEIFESYLSREELEDLIRDKINETVEMTDRVLHRPKVEALGEIDNIVLAGGSAQIPLIRDLLEKKLNRPVKRGNDIDKMISFGAAILAEDIGKNDIQTQQMTSVQIGVAVTQGVMFHRFKKIIPEDAPLPCENSADFNLMHDGQRSLKIAYYEYDVKNYPDAKFVVDDGIQEIDVLNIENLPAGLDKDDTIVRVTFRVNADGGIDFKAAVLNGSGEEIGGGALTVKKESDLI